MSNKTYDTSKPILRGKMIIFKLKDNEELKELFVPITGRLGKKEAYKFLPYTDKEVTIITIGNVSERLDLGYDTLVELLKK